MNTTGMTIVNGEPVVVSVVPNTGLPTPPIAVHQPHERTGRLISGIPTASTPARTGTARAKWCHRRPRSRSQVGAPRRSDMEVARASCTPT